MRGRLIQRFKVDIARLDEAATAAVVGGGYDEDFKEPVPVDDGTQLGADSRRYHDVVTLTCQLDRDERWGDQRSTRGGNNVQADLVLVLHRGELERMGLIDANGAHVFRKGDKIIQLRTLKGAVQRNFDDPPGMFVESWDLAGHGLEAFGTPQQNLIYMYCKYDEKGGTE